MTILCWGGAVGVLMLAGLLNWLAVRCLGVRDRGAPPEGDYARMKRPPRYRFSSGLYTVSRNTLNGSADTWTGQREIWVDPRLSGRHELETFIHEALHAEFPHDREQRVDRTAVALARFLWRIGYKKRRAR